MEETIREKHHSDISHGRPCYGSGNGNGNYYYYYYNNNHQRTAAVPNGNLKMRRFTGRGYYSAESLLLLVALMASLLILPLILPPLPPPPFMLLLVPVGIFVVLLALAFMPGNGRDVTTYGYM